MEKRIYLSKNSAIFFKTREEYGELSNMASGFPIHFGEIFNIPSSEALYQMLRYTEYPEIQYEIANTNSAMAAKMKSKKYLSYTRQDWKRKRVVFMRWCIRMKYNSNKDRFKRILLSTSHLDIVEKSRKDDFWGAVEEDEYLIGHNILGRLLMELRGEIYAGCEPTIYLPDVPEIKIFGVGAETLLLPKSNGEKNIEFFSPLFSNL